MTKKKMFFIDPMSYNNLAMYDYEILSKISDWDIYYFCNRLYSYKNLPNIKERKVFSYNKYKKKFCKALSYSRSLLIVLFNILLVHPKIIHIQWIRIPVLDYYFYRFVKYVFRVKLVYTVHNILPHVTKKNDRINYGKFYRICDLLLVHTESSKRDLISKFNFNGSNIIVVSHGILKYDFKDSEIKIKIDEFREKFDIKNKVVFSLLGGQTEAKGSDLALDAWINSPLLRTHKRAVLLIAGKFIDKKVPADLPENIIYIPKRFSDLEFQVLLKITTVLLLPYRRIEQSGLLLTAVCDNIPYCATQVGELLVPQTIADIGWRINDVSVKEVANTIEYIISNTDEINQKRNNKKGWDKVLNYYDWGKNVRLTLESYEKLIS